MPRNMVIGKLRYLIGLGSGLFLSPSLNLVLMSAHGSVGAATPGVVPWFVDLLYSRGVTLIHKLERKGKTCVGDLVPMRVFMSALQG